MLKRYRVTGRSMLPAFREGDYVLVRKPHHLKRGDVIVLKRTTDERIMLKRIERVCGDALFVAGDNSTFSRDSRHFGPVNRQEIVGKVWMHVKRA